MMSGSKDKRTKKAKKYTIATASSIPMKNAMKHSPF